jgi:hypothetical protein
LKLLFSDCCFTQESALTEPLCAEVADSEHFVSVMRTQAYGHAYAAFSAAPAAAVAAAAAAPDSMHSDGAMSYSRGYQQPNFYPFTAIQSGISNKPSKINVLKKLHS